MISRDGCRGLRGAPRHWTARRGGRAAEGAAAAPPHRDSKTGTFPFLLLERA
jgi:hypothetical protein